MGTDNDTKYQDRWKGHKMDGVMSRKGRRAAFIYLCLLILSRVTDLCARGYDQDLPLRRGCASSECLRWPAIG